jgi:hypothetical protein
VVPRSIVPRNARNARRALGALAGGVLAATSTLLATGCGGGARQDAHEPKGTFNLQVTRASFPSGQAIAKPVILELSVHNAGANAVPNLAVTLDSFEYAEKYAELAASKRPIWVIERGPGAIPRRPVRSQAVSPPGGAVTNYVNTWALGRLASGGTQTFTWLVVPVKSGLRTVHYTVAAGLGGRASAVNAAGGPVQGQFAVNIAAAPPSRHVDPATGRVVPGQFPLVP